MSAAETPRSLRTCTHTLLRSAAFPQASDEVDIVVQLNATGAVQLHLFQCLANHIIRLPFRGLHRLDGCGLVHIAAIVDVEFTESIGEAEDVALLELRVLPVVPVSADPRLAGFLAYLCSLRTFMVRRMDGVEITDEGAGVIANRKKLIKRQPGKDERRAWLFP